jgi:hypothetical protein
VFQLWDDRPRFGIIRKVEIGIRLLIQIEEFTCECRKFGVVLCQLFDLSKGSRRRRIPGFEFLQDAKHFGQGLFGISKLSVAFLCIFASVKDTFVAFCLAARAWRRARALHGQVSFGLMADFRKCHGTTDGKADDGGYL